MAAAVNVGIRQAAERWLGVAAGQQVLSLTVLLAATGGTVVLACLALALLGQTQARPFTIFRRLTTVAFLLAGAAALLAYLGWLPGVPTVSYETLLVLVGMNAVTAVCCVAFLTTIPRAARRVGGF